MSGQWQPPRYDPRQHQRVDPAYRGAPVRVHPKSPAAALIMSLFIPGLGSMYAGKPGWGIAILLLWLVSIPLTLVLIGWITLPVCWIAGMWSGFADARRWNADRGIES